jgi:hypothetical protein
MALRRWKDDSNIYSLPCPSVRDKLLTVVGGDVPNSPFIALAGLLPSAGMISRETAVSFGSPPRFIFFIFPRLHAAFQAAINFFLSNR